MSNDEWCMHDQVLGTCTICSGKDVPTTRSSTRASATAEVLDSPAALEKYRSRYPGDREATFEAYVDVFFRLTGARAFPGGWTALSRCANAEPALVAREPALVARAEELMRAGGYEADDTGRPQKGRRWVRRVS